MAIKLIVCDIDGTLVDRRGRIHALTIKALAEAVEKGVLLTVATGRAFSQAQEVAVQIGCNVPLICCNGGLICDEKTEYFRCVLDDDLIEPAVMLAEQFGLGAFLFSQGSIYLYLSGDSHEEYIQKSLVLESDRNSVRSLRDLEDLRNVVHCGVEKLYFSSSDPAALAKARWNFEDACHYHRFDNCYVTSSLEDNFEIMPQGITKGSALKLLSERLGVAKEEIIAFGDNENDVDMLKFCGLGVAMGNAAPGAIAAARVVTDPVDKGGVGTMLEKVLLANYIDRVK